MQERERTGSSEVAVTTSAEAADFRTHQVGQIADIDAEGRPSVIFPGSWLEPVRARTTILVDEAEAVGIRVLLVFEDGDPKSPIIIGTMRESVRSTVDPTLPAPSQEAGEQTGRGVDARDLVLEGQKSLTLRCGKSLVSLHEDGRILLRGSHILSRSTGPQRIKGASINLN